LKINKLKYLFDGVFENCKMMKCNFIG